METRGHRVNVQFEDMGTKTVNKRSYTTMLNSHTQSISELPKINDSEESIPITSGLLQARLLKERFICPGINRECIEYQGQLITPKTFYVMADKGSLKDWKNAIRIHGKKIRRYIDSGELDFYNHDQLCTGRCKSRMSQKFTITDSVNGPLMVPKSSPKTTHSFKPAKEAFSMMKDIEWNSGLDEEVDVKPDLEQLNNLLQLQAAANGNLNLSTAQPLHIISVKSVADVNDDDVMFWRAIVQLGLIDEFFREVKSKLDFLKASMVKNFVPVSDAKQASRIVNELGMRAKLDMKLSAHKFEFDRQRDRLEREMEALKRKVSECEAKNEMLKQKSNCYDKLMTKNIKLDEMPSDLPPAARSLLDPVSPTSMVLAQEDSRSTSASPYTTQDQDTSPFTTQETGSITMTNEDSHSRSTSPFPSQDSMVASASASHDSLSDSNVQPSLEDVQPSLEDG